MYVQAKSHALLSITLLATPVLINALPVAQTDSVNALSLATKSEALSGQYEESAAIPSTTSTPLNRRADVPSWICSLSLVQNVSPDDLEALGHIDPGRLRKRNAQTYTSTPYPSNWDPDQLTGLFEFDEHNLQRRDPQIFSTVPEGEIYSHTDFDSFLKRREDTTKEQEFENPLVVRETDDITQSDMDNWQNALNFPGFERRDAQAPY